MSGCGLMLGARSDMSAPVGSWRALEDAVPNNGGTPMRVLIVHPGVYVYRGGGVAHSQAHELCEREMRERSPRIV
jgi:hypothetical protein